MGTFCHKFAVILGETGSGFNTLVDIDFMDDLAIYMHNIGELPPPDHIANKPRIAVSEWTQSTWILNAWYFPKEMQPDTISPSFISTHPSDPALHLARPLLGTCAAMISLRGMWDTDDAYDGRHSRIGSFFLWSWNANAALELGLVRHHAMLDSRGLRTQLHIQFHSEKHQFAPCSITISWQGILLMPCELRRQHHRGRQSQCGGTRQMRHCEAAGMMNVSLAA